MARLVVESGEDLGMVYPIGNGVLLGRGPECDVRVMDRRVSRHHARITALDYVFTLEDLESRNGTTLNHYPVNGKAELRNGDFVALGGTNFIFELDSDEGPARHPRTTRVRMATGSQPLLHAEKPVDVDTATPIAHSPLPREAIKDPNQRLKILYQVSDAMRGELEMERLLWKVMHLIWRVMAPDRAIIFLRENGQGLTAIITKTARPDEHDIVISRAVVDRSLEDRAAILMADAPRDPHFSATDSIIRGNIHSIICAPLVAQREPFGAIYLDIQEGLEREGKNRAFTRDDLELMTGITNQAALALENARLHSEALNHQRLERELEIARDIQEQLLPTRFPALDGVDFAARCTPARQVGGDYYDVFEVGDGCTAVVLGDASGKGVPAAISVAMLRTAIRSRIRGHRRDDLAGVMEDLNSTMCHDSFRDNFITVFVLIYCPSGQVVYCNAGHVPPLLLKADGTLQKLTAGGPLLAALPDATYESGRVILKPTDVLLLYSDGLTDTHSLAGDMYGEEQLIQVLSQHNGESARKICDYIVESVVRFRETREPFDDMTLVVLKAGPSETTTQQSYPGIND